MGTTALKPSEGSFKFHLIYKLLVTIKSIMKLLVVLCLISSVISDSEPDADADPLTLYGNVAYQSAYPAYQGYNTNGYPVYNAYSNLPTYQFTFPSNNPVTSYQPSYQPSMTNNFVPGLTASYPLNQALNYPITATIQFPGVQGLQTVQVQGLQGIQGLQNLQGVPANMNNFPQQLPQLSPLGTNPSSQDDSSVQAVGKNFAPSINRFSPTPTYSGYQVLNNIPTANYNSNLNDGYGYNNQINSDLNNQGSPSKYGGTGYMTSPGGVYQVNKRSADSDPDPFLYSSYPVYTYSSYPSYSSGYLTPYYQPTYYHSTYTHPSLKSTYSLLKNYADAINLGYNPSTGVVYNY